MDKYLITYEYKEKNGCLVSTKTVTKVFNSSELHKLTYDNDSYDNYVKILFCQKL